MTVQTQAPASLSFMLFVVFLILKLTGIITWPWIWVFAPLWIGALVLIALLLLVLLIAVAAGTYK